MIKGKVQCLAERKNPWRTAGSAYIAREVQEVEDRFIKSPAMLYCTKCRVTEKVILQKQKPLNVLTGRVEDFTASLISSADFSGIYISDHFSHEEPVSRGSAVYPFESPETFYRSIHPWSLFSCSSFFSRIVLKGLIMPASPGSHPYQHSFRKDLPAPHRDLRRVEGKGFKCNPFF